MNYVITDITVQKRNQNRLNIFINGEFYKSTTPYIVKKFKLEKGKEIDPAVLEEAILEDSLEKAKGYVVDFHLNKPKKVIQDKLKAKGYEEEVIKRTMDFLEHYKLVNDNQYAKSFSHDSIFLKKHGKNRIKQSLKQKGVADEDIHEALERISEDDEIDVATKLLEKKIDSYIRKLEKKYEKPNEYKYELKNKCQTFLMQRGYNFEIAATVTERVVLSLDLFDDF